MPNYMLVAYGAEGFKHWEVVFPSDTVQNPLEFSSNMDYIGLFTEIGKMLTVLLAILTN